MLSAPHVLPGPCAWPGCPAAGPHCHIACPTCRTPRCGNLDCATCRQAWIRGQDPPAGDTTPDSQRRTFFYRLLVHLRAPVETMCPWRLACVSVQGQHLQKARGLSQRELARLAGVPYRTLASSNGAGL
jgi:hypothetical protein